jgi:phosphocarrier protein
MVNRYYIVHTIIFNIPNKLGLHARASIKLVNIANKYLSNVTIAKDHKRSNAKSLMEVMLLSAGHGSQITVTADGIDEEAVILEISELINNKFDELE